MSTAVNDDEISTLLFRQFKDATIAAQKNIAYVDGNKITEKRHRFEGADNNTSFVFCNFNDQEVTIPNKVNHIIISRCKKTKFILHSAISGIDIIHSSECSMKLEKADYLNLEYSYGISIETDAEQYNIMLFHCSNLSFNSKRLPGNEFTETLFTQEGHVNVDRNTLQSLELSVPLHQEDRSLNE